MRSDPIYRPIEPEDHSSALELWDAVFPPGQGYFERYFRADPWYQAGDSLGAWVDGTLASAVHVCRRPLRWNGRSVLCGAISNVATLPEYRKRGLSRKLLELAIRRMDADRFAFSMLFTGTHAHYAPLGWEQTLQPHARIELTPGASHCEKRRAEPTPEVIAWYQELPSPPLQLERSAGYFTGWVGWNWERWDAALLTREGPGYAVVRLPGDPHGPARLCEWRAPDARAERELLAAAAGWGAGKGRPALMVEALPRLSTPEALAELGRVDLGTSGGMMLRNISLAEDEYREVVRLYATGAANWWTSDGF